MKDFMMRMTTKESLNKAIAKIKSILLWTIIITSVFGTSYLAYQKNLEDIRIQIINDEIRMNAICPGLLSISRSARDTLIVMKAEPLCNRFVLDTLE